MLPIWKDTSPYFDPEKRQFPASLIPFLLSGEDHPCCLVIPGGGYVNKAWDHEGVAVAEWFNRIGVSAFVLDYRISPYDGRAILADGKQALLYVRKNARRFGVDPHRIGVCGFSAGGHLAGCVSTLFDNEEERPDFSIYCYPVMTLVPDEAVTHLETTETFLGDRVDDPNEQKRFSPSRQVRAACPPAFFWTTATDETVPPKTNAFAAYEAYRAAGVLTEMVCFDHGAHGLGIPSDDPEIASWTDRCEAWLKKIGIL